MDMWNDATYEQVVDAGVFIAGSPETVTQRLEEAVRGLRVGHVIAILQIQSMEPELTNHNTRLFAERVLPKVRTIWDAEGYEDHWWPTGATRYSDGRTAVGVTASGTGA
jgi:hypothetical protein